MHPTHDGRYIHGFSEGFDPRHGLKEQVGGDGVAHKIWTKRLQTRDCLIDRELFCMGVYEQDFTARML